MVKCRQRILYNDMTFILKTNLSLPKSDRIFFIIISINALNQVKMYHGPKSITSYIYHQNSLTQYFLNQNINLL